MKKTGLATIRGLALVLVASLVKSVEAAPGDLDPTFGVDGAATVSIGSLDDHGQALAIQSDGSIVVAGYTFNGANEDFALARFTPDGVLDAGFGVGGVVTTPIGSFTDFAVSAVVEQDDGILVAGSSSNGSDEDFAVARFLADGALAPIRQ